MNIMLKLPQKMRRWPVYVIVVVAVLAALAAAYTWLSLTWSYAEGERAGYVQTFFKKGWLCKTWEGELAMVAMPGTLAEKFRFSVRDEAVAASINQTMGQRVALVYQQHVGVPTSCFGENSHFVVGLRRID